MFRTILQGMQRSLAAIVVGSLVAACAETGPTAPDRRVAILSEVADLTTHAPPLGQCDTLAAPAGNTLAFQVFARGVQIYRWNGASWAFVAPDAELFANEGSQGVIGTHYAGPTWEGGGGKVVAAANKRCTPDANAIPWLLLNAVSTQGHGRYARTTYIQRLNTVGGLAPSAPGTVVGQEAHVPYTADYVFYRAE